MPIYEYACPQCHKIFEEWLKADDEAHTHPCPDCGAQAERFISQTSFILKGKGWYVTEYGNKNIDTAEHEPKTKDDKAEQKTENTKESAADKPADSGKPADNGKSADSGKADKTTPAATPKAAPPSSSPSSGTA